MVEISNRFDIFETLPMTHWTAFKIAENSLVAVIAITVVCRSDGVYTSN